MTDPRMWVDVNAAANILKVSSKTIHRLIREGKLYSRQPRPHSTRILRRSICELCSPGLKNPPLDCLDCSPATSILPV